MSTPRSLLLVGTDPLVRRRVGRVASTFDAEVVETGAGGADSTHPEPIALVVELELEGSVATIREWREALSGLTIVGYVGTPAPDLWREAERAGADAVTTRGLVDRELARLVDDRLSGRRRSRRIRLASEKDFAGRLGYLGRLAETPAGPIAIYHVGNRIHAVADACPHAGASLCEGELSGEVVTCPRHGSQFRVTDGERVRGPADVGIERFPVVVEAGEVFVELPG